MIRQDRSKTSALITIRVRRPVSWAGASIGAIPRAVGWICPSFPGKILFIEAIDRPSGRLPIGHGPSPGTIPLGTLAAMDTMSRTLTLDAGVL